MGEGVINPEIKYARIGYERIVNAIERLVDELEVPEEHYEKICRGVLILLYSLPPPKETGHG